MQLKYRKILKLNENSDLNNKLNFNASSFITEKHINKFIHDYEEIATLGKGT